jgi:hypothetical protein
VVKALTIDGTTQDVVYVATEANNIYAISASSGPALGTILVQRKLGTPVPRPLVCRLYGQAQSVQIRSMVFIFF